MQTKQTNAKTKKNKNKTKQTIKKTGDNDDMVAYFGAVSDDAMVLLRTNGSLSIDVDLSNLEYGSCSSGLAVRIFEDWTHDSLDSTTDSCSDYVGDLYDPTATCAPGSANEFCTDDLLCDEASYNYTCDFTNDPFNCAPGDLTGKFGLIATDSDGTLLGYDPIMVDLSLLGGKSIVIQCADDWSMLACAKIQALGIFFLFPCLFFVLLFFGSVILVVHSSFCYIFCKCFDAYSYCLA